MFSIPGYHIKEQLYNGSRTLVFRAVRKNDPKPVVIKLLKNYYPSFSELVQFRNQYIIAKNLNSPRIIQTYSLEPYQNGYALVMEDMGGISLKEYFTKYNNIAFQNIASLQVFLQIAISLCDTLDVLYHHRIIHQDIKPANILINPATKQVKLIDFSIASLLPQSTQTLMNPHVLEGTLGYISPEQTGRMNRGIDYRTDFYSLGITFYELLTNELPFQSEDPMELVHYHIAKKPPALNNSENIPQVLGDIVMKLMAKNAEDRYQSAWGLKYDLEICLQQLQETGKIECWKIAQRDICDRFIIPEKLYGREAEVNELLAAFARVAGISSGNLKESGNERKVELMLIAGFSGIGKTAIVNEVHKPIVRQRGYFIKGKFDQFNRNIPFFAFVQALRDLMGYLLNESDAQLSNWQNKILQVLGENGQVIIDVIPELEKIIGPQPPVTELSGTAAQNRFNLLFQKFIQVFTVKEHPLVIFLDDLQWADSASLNLIKLLMSESQTDYLLMIGAYRDNEVFPAHPLMLMLDEVDKKGTQINTITLEPLNKANLNLLVTDTLLCSTKVAQPLTDIIYQKTQGNPFFATQFLKALYEDRLIEFDIQAGYWQCDISQVRSAALTDDVVELMANQLQKLPTNTQEILQLAACIGNQFDLSTLAIISEKSAANAADVLWKALQSGLILPQNEVYKFYLGDDGQNVKIDNINNVEYRFLHDRVQQAAYSLIPEDCKQITHLRIGRLLLQNTSPREREENLFKIVNQLNIGIPLLGEGTEREELAKLNLTTARKAKSSAAYGAAMSYLKIAIALMSANPWQTDYGLMLQLHNLLAEVSYLNGEFVEAEQQIQIVLDNATELLDCIKVYEIRIQLLVAQKRCQSALDIGLEILSLLNISLNHAPLPDINIDRLYNLPPITHRQTIAALSILSKLWAPAFIANPGLLPPIILTMLNLSATHGNSATGAFAYALYGMLLCATMKDIELGYSFGQLALHTLEQYEDAELTCKVNQLFHAFIRNWKELAHNGIECLANNVQIGLETGDIEFACYSAINYCDNLCLIGEPLTSIHQKQAYYIELTHSLRQEFQYFAALIWGQFVENLMGAVVNPKQLVGERFDEYKEIPQLRQANAFTALFFLYTAKTILHYLFNDYEGTLANSESAAEYEQAGGGLLPITQIPLYRALALLALYSTANLEQQTQMLADIRSHQQRLEIWATHAPENFQHKVDLIAAETAKILSHKHQAIDLYERAISGAKVNGYIQEEALANELMGKFYLEWGKEKAAIGYMQEAYYCYARWGAKAKTEDLEKRYPQLLAPILQQHHSYPGLGENLWQTVDKSSVLNQTIQTAYSSSSISQVLDFASILKASQALSSEIQLEQLISNLLQVMVENAGAKKAALLLLKDDTLILEAVATINEGVKLLNLPCADSKDIPSTVINYVKRTLKIVVLDNATTENNFIADSYLMQQQPLSLLCIPILNQGKLIGLLYLENKLTIGAFTQDRVEILHLLCTQAAISLENAQLYGKLENYSHTLELKVDQRTQELTQKATQLESALKELQRTQTQLIQAEKMSGLGQLVAGIAHEINNPINFIYGNLTPANQYVESLIQLIHLYQEFYPQSPPEIKSEIADIELDFLIEDLPKLLISMKTGAQRIRDIVLSLRNFSRLDEAQMKFVDIHPGIDSTLLILQHQLTSNREYQEIAVIKEYNQLPKVNCYPSELNQVFLNIITNAIDALQGNSSQSHQPRITIRTSIKDDQNVLISIADNGAGISQSVLNKIFDPFFTTKPVGNGTGLGLSISYSIVVEKHKGKLSCISAPGEGTEFVIELPLCASNK